MFFYIVLTPISITSGLLNTGNMRKYHQIDVYIYQCVGRHIKTHKAENLVCAKCNKVYNGERNLKRHVQEYRCQCDIYQCGVCHITFNNHLKLVKHIKTHDFNKLLDKEYMGLHRCTVCSGFLSRGQIINTIRNMLTRKRNLFYMLLVEKN